MNIYFLCKRYYTNKDLINDRFGRLYHLPLQLAHHGARIQVVALDYRNRATLDLNEASVLFQTLPANPLMPVFLWKIYSQARAAKPDIIMASGDIYIGYVGLRIARALGIPFVFDVYDYYPAFPINRIAGMKALFHHTIKKASLVLCASAPLQELILAGLNDNALLIENGVDRAVFKPQDKNSARQRLNLPLNIPIIGFFGSVAPCKGPLLIDACHLLSQKYPDLKLLLAGRVTNVDIHKPWIHYLGERPQAEIPALINACDVVVVPLANHPQNDVSGACKIAEYLACGAAVVATRVSNHAQIFQHSPASLCEPDAVDMARAISAQLENPKFAPFPESLDWQAIGASLYCGLSGVGR
jgi:glycosyltransferase involved in cell wall biosynthesis